MKRIIPIVLAALLVCTTACKNKENTTAMSNIDDKTISATIEALHQKFGDGCLERAQRSVPQTASLWTSKDGSADDFKEFCLNHFVDDSTALQRMADQLQANLESLWGCFNKMSVDLKLPLHVSGPEPTALDEMFGGYDPYAHFDDDMFEQKIAFAVVLNFPFYTLDEKNELGKNWSRKQWAYARLGDLFTSRAGQPAGCGRQLHIELQYHDGTPGGRPR